MMIDARDTHSRLPAHAWCAAAGAMALAAALGVACAPQEDGCTGAQCEDISLRPADDYKGGSDGSGTEGCSHAGSGNGDDDDDDYEDSGDGSGGGTAAEGETGGEGCPGGSTG